MFPEVMLVIMWFAFANSFPGVEAVYQHAVGFDMRPAVVGCYVLSVALRVVGRRSSIKFLESFGAGLGLLAAGVSILALWQVHRLR